MIQAWATNHAPLVYCVPTDVAKLTDILVLPYMSFPIDLVPPLICHLPLDFFKSVYDLPLEQLQT